MNQFNDDSKNQQFVMLQISDQKISEPLCLNLSRNILPHEMQQILVQVQTPNNFPYDEEVIDKGSMTNLYLNIKSTQPKQKTLSLMMNIHWTYLFVLEGKTIVSNLINPIHFKLPVSNSQLFVSSIPTQVQVWIASVPPGSTASVLLAAQFFARNKESITFEALQQQMKIGFSSGFQNQQAVEIDVVGAAERLRKLSNKTSQTSFRHILSSILPRLCQLKKFGVGPLESAKSLNLPQGSVLQLEISNLQDSIIQEQDYKVIFNLQQGVFEESIKLPAQVKVAEFQSIARQWQQQFYLGGDYQLLGGDLQRLKDDFLPQQFYYVELQQSQVMECNNVEISEEKVQLLANVLMQNLEYKPILEFPCVRELAKNSQILVKVQPLFHKDIFDYSQFSLQDVAIQLSTLQKLKISNVDKARNSVYQKIKKASSETYEIDYVVARKPVLNTTMKSSFYPQFRAQQFLIHWTGYSTDQRTWEPEWNFEGTVNYAITAFNQVFGAEDQPFCDGVLVSAQTEEDIRQMTDIIEKLIDEERKTRNSSGSYESSLYDDDDS